MNLITPPNGSSSLIIMHVCMYGARIRDTVCGGYVGLAASYIAGDTYTYILQGSGSAAYRRHRPPRWWRKNSAMDKT